MQKFILSLLIIFGAYLTAAGQWCGTTETEQIKEQLLKNKRAFLENGIKRGGKTYVPIRWHIVRKSDGTGGVTELAIDEQMCELNDSYTDANIVFFIKDKSYNYINSTLLYTQPSSGAGATKMIVEKANKGKNAVNIFVCQSANTQSGLGTTLGYYSPTYDHIVIRINQINKTSGTLSHEMGHFLSLLHTHNGWDSEPYNATKHGNPVSSKYSPSGVLIELADRTNCETAGDYLCDTREDYNFGFGWSGCNTYTAGTKDPNGDLCDPDEKNFMGYFIGCDKYFFSNDQITMMQADLASSKRDYLKTSYVPFTGDLNAVEVQFPTNGDVVDTYNYVQLEWKDVENAYAYYVEIKQGINKYNYYTKASTVILTELKADKTISWKVKALSETGNCSGSTAWQKFKTGTTVNTIDTDNESIQIYPTLVNNQRFTIESTNAVSSQLVIQNISGQVVSQQNLELVEGRNEVRTNNLPAGIYFCTVHAKDMKLTKKIIVQ